MDAGHERTIVQEVKARSVVTTFVDYARALGQIRGRHKAIIYIGTGVGCRISPETHPDPQKALQQGGGDRFADLSSAGTAAPSDALQQILCTNETWDAVRALVQASSTVYAIDPRGTMNPTWVSPSVDGRGGPGPAMRRMGIADPAARPALSDGFHVISGQTGGFAVMDTNNFNQALGRIVTENSAYYLIGYASTNDKPDGKYRRTKITVGRPGVELFYRTGYMARRH
jgi:VWFA-related protein